MNRAGRLVQVSDCHLSADPRALYRGSSADAGLHALAPAIEAFAPDWIVLSGDLSEDASPESYARIVAWARQLSCPVAWLPGNHDDRSVMAPIFEAAGFAAGPVIGADGWQLALLDSAVVDRPAGMLDEARLAALDSLDPARPSGVFVHHQPLPVGAAWIDKVPLEQPERLLRRLGANIRFVAFGHVHQRFRCEHNGIQFLACPSTASNSLPATARFTPGETTPLARWYVLDDSDFRTGYLAPAASSSRSGPHAMF